MDYLRFLYGTLPGRLLLKPLTAPWLSELSGHILDHPVSRILIPGFIRTNHIDMSEYEKNFRSQGVKITRVILKAKEEK